MSLFGIVVLCCLIDMARDFSPCTALSRGNVGCDQRHDSGRTPFRHYIALHERAVPVHGKAVAGPGLSILQTWNRPRPTSLCRKRNGDSRTVRVATGCDSARRDRDSRPDGRSAGTTPPSGGLQRADIRS